MPAAGWKAVIVTRDVAAISKLKLLAVRFCEIVRCFELD